MEVDCFFFFLPLPHLAAVTKHFEQASPSVKTHWQFMMLIVADVAYHSKHIGIFETVGPAS